MSEYKTAVDEIRRRVDYEQDLFLLKFGICAAVLAAVFKFLKRTGRDGDDPNPDWDDGIAMKDHAVRAVGNWVLGYSFFWAAALASAIIDSRLRYNAKMVETLGCWIFLFESPTKKLLWETYLRAEGVFFEPPMYALLRVFPNNLLTILLFAGVVYFSLIMDRETKGMARWCAASTLALFCTTCISFHSESKIWLLHCSLWALAGCLGLLRNSRTLKAMRLKLSWVKQT